MTEAHQNFSRVARLVDEKGFVVITKNNKPCYLIIDLSEADTMQMAPDDSVLSVSQEIIQNNRKSYDGLGE